ncbi:hypothetical protein SPWS13_3430 [Shewanella putrefaciens]|nr:hypothetical protein SPWS13_3430 [Shewanella putrefaciens]
MVYLDKLWMSCFTLFGLYVAKFNNGCHDKLFRNEKSKKIIDIEKHFH